VDHQEEVSTANSDRHRVSTEKTTVAELTGEVDNLECRMGTDPIVLQVFHLESIVEWQLEALQKHRIEVVCTDCCLTMHKFAAFVVRIDMTVGL
jgi:hypothetical protein